MQNLRFKVWNTKRQLLIISNLKLESLIVWLELMCPNYMSIFLWLFEHFKSN